MGALRTKMIEEMKLRNFSPRTEQSYVSAMIGLVKHHRRSPDQLTQDEIRSYLLHLQERGRSPSSRNVAISGMKFFYHRILGWNEQRLFLPPRKKSWRLPEVLPLDQRAAQFSVSCHDGDPPLPACSNLSAKDLLLKLTGVDLSRCPYCHTSVPAAQPRTREPGSRALERMIVY